MTVTTKIKKKKKQIFLPWLFSHYVQRPILFHCWLWNCDRFDKNYIQLICERAAEVGYFIFRSFTSCEVWRNCFSSQRFTLFQERVQMRCCSVPEGTSLNCTEKIGCNVDTAQVLSRESKTILGSLVKLQYINHQIFKWRCQSALLWLNLLTTFWISTSAQMELKMSSDMIRPLFKPLCNSKSNVDGFSLTLVSVGFSPRN